MPIFPPQHKSLAIGLGLIGCAAAVVVLVWIGTYLPGFAGEVFSVVAGIMWTPVLLDISLFVLGLALVIWLNTWRRKREGDEYVYLEQIEGPSVPHDLPREARSAVFRERPEPLDDRLDLAAIEGALELDDLAAATNLLMELAPEDLDLPDVLALRIDLARRRGHHDDAETLLRELRLKCPRHPGCSPPE